MPEPTAQPLWDEVELPQFPAPDRDVTVDVVVIGAGLTGITAAHLLKEAGVKVALLDRGGVGGTDTGCTTAHLTVVVDADLPSLASSFGDDHARAVWDAGFAALDQIDTIVTGLGIDCDFLWVPGFRHVAVDAGDERRSSQLKHLEEEAALATRLGFDVTPVARTPLFDSPGWRIENQAVFHPRKYLRGMLETLPGAQCRVYGDSEIRFDERGNCHVGSHRINADWVVVTTHNPIAGRASPAAAALLQTRLALFTSYAAAGARQGDDDLLGCYWDTGSPYRYVRVNRAGPDLTVVAGGEDHKTGQSEDTRKNFAALEQWATPLVTGGLRYRWSGQVIETADKLPIIGVVSDKQFAATGFAGNGMTFGTLAAMMAHDAVTGRANPWTELFGPNRSALAHKPWDYLRQNADYPYYMIRDRFAGPESRSLRAIPRGSGRLVDFDGQVVAASRDERGRLTTLSATCTHLGCRVTWNAAERTWDCPCHGSRFTSTGEVLAGPAAKPLSPADVPGKTRQPEQATAATLPR